MIVRRFLGAVAVLVLVTVPTFAGHTSRTSAQTATPLEWRFAPLSIFGDERLVLGLNLLMDAQAAAASAEAPVTLTYGDPSVAAQLATTSKDAATLLLQASGVFDQQNRVQSLEVTRPCAVWAPAGDDTPAAVAQALGAELARVFSEHGLPVEPCAVTTDAGGADLFVYPSGAPPAGVDFMAYQRGGSFLAPVPPPGNPAPAPEPNPGGPSPASSGSLGAPLSGGGLSRWTVGAIIALTIALGLGARASTRRSR